MNKNQILAVVIGFAFPVMSTIYNLWGFLIPYVAAKVVLLVQAHKPVVFLRLDDNSLHLLSIGRFDY
jgi:hypothetical protein